MEDIRAIAVPIREANLNTDQIIPARYLKKPRGKGYQDYLLHDLRFDEHEKPRDDYVLNLPRYKGAQIVVGGQNFACGSSREGAVYALADYGIRCVIACGFSDIFYANCIKNLVVPVILPDPEVEALWEYLDTADRPELMVSLRDRRIVAGNRTIEFALEEQVWERLMSGRDDVDETLEHLPAIERYESTTSI